MSDPASLPAKDVTALLRRVRQTRDFRADPVPEDALLDILDVARWTGSVSNSQPWTFIVVTDSEARRKMAEAAPYTAHIGVAPVVIVIAHDDSGNLETDNYDEGRLTERIMTAATAHGLACGLARADGPAGGRRRHRNHTRTRPRRGGDRAACTVASHRPA